MKEQDAGQEGTYLNVGTNRLLKRLGLRDEDLKEGHRVTNQVTSAGARRWGKAEPRDKKGQ